MSETVKNKELQADSADFQHCFVCVLDLYFSQLSFMF